MTPRTTENDYLQSPVLAQLLQTAGKQEWSQYSVIYPIVCPLSTYLLQEASMQVPQMHMDPSSG